MYGVVLVGANGPKDCKAKKYSDFLTTCLKMDILHKHCKKCLFLIFWTKEIILPFSITYFLLLQN